MKKALCGGLLSWESWVRQGRAGGARRNFSKGVRTMNYQTREKKDESLQILREQVNTKQNINCLILTPIDLREESDFGSYRKYMK
jgi:hypothetical protein